MRSHRPSMLELDSRAIQILAHPLRARILTELRLSGSATATSIAASLGTNTGATSYHLRKLATVGLVEEGQPGRGRERWWTPSTDAHRWGPRTVLGDADGQAAENWLQRHYLQQFVERYSSWLDGAGSSSLDWQEAAGASDRVLALSPDRLQSLSAEILSVIERYADTPDEPGNGGQGGDRPGNGEPGVGEPGGGEQCDNAPDSDVRRVLVYLSAFPLTTG